MAGATTVPFRPKQDRPELNRARGFMSQLIIAAAPGWEHGFGNTIDRAVPESVLQGGAGDNLTALSIRAHWDDTVQDDNYPKDPPNGIGMRGRAYKQLLDTDVVKFGNTFNTGNPDHFTDRDTPDSITVACTYRTSSVHNLTTDMIWQRRGNPFGAANAGWSIGLNAAGGYDWSVSNGAAEVRLSSITAQQNRRPDLLIGVLDRNAGLMKFFVNGQLEASAATAIVIGDTNLSPRIYGGVAGDIAHGMVDMVAFWNRALTQGELNQLYADPFILWRFSSAQEGVEGFADLLGDGCGCCCESIFNFGLR